MITVHCPCIPMLLFPMSPPPEDGSADQQQQNQPSDRPAHDSSNRGPLPCGVTSQCSRRRVGKAAFQQLRSVTCGNGEAVQAERFRVVGVRHRDLHCVVLPCEVFDATDEPVPHSVRIAGCVRWRYDFERITVDGTGNLGNICIGPVKCPDVHTPN